MSFKGKLFVPMEHLLFPISQTVTANIEPPSYLVFGDNAGVISLHTLELIDAFYVSLWVS